jgi:hypothetical protein
MVTIYSCKRHKSGTPYRDRIRLQDRNGEDANIEYWKREWENFESDKAVVDVDVRGWLCKFFASCTFHFIIYLP